MSQFACERRTVGMYNMQVWGVLAMDARFGLVMTLVDNLDLISCSDRVLRLGARKAKLYAPRSLFRRAVSRLARSCNFDEVVLSPISTTARPNVQSPWRRLPHADRQGNAEILGQLL